MNVTVGVLGTSVSLPAALGVAGIKGWALGLALTAGLGIALAWAKKALPGIVTSWVMSRVQSGLDGNGTEPGAFRELIHDITLCLVVFAEKELPDAGLGAARLALLERTVCSIPVVGIIFSWIITTKPKEWNEIVEACVAKLDEELKKIPKP